jgi:PAS domain S-box-containing protein
MPSIEILIVEDESIVAADLQDSLQHMGYRVAEVVDSGEDAIRILENRHIDLVIMDIGLKGGIDGTKTAGIIRERFFIPVIYLTAYSDDKTIEKAKRTEPYGYILKPFEEKELHSIIEMALYKFKMESELRESEEKFRRLFEESRDAIFISDLEGRLIDVNTAALDLFGFAKDELLRGFNLSEVFVNPKSILRLQRKIEKRGFIRDYEIKLKRKDGLELDCLISTSLRQDEKGVIRGYQGNIRDISSSKIAERELKSSFEKLKKAMTGTIKAMALTVETRDPYTAGHQRRVANLAVAIGRELKLSRDRIDGIEMAGVVHDLGKISVPAEILSKPGRLTETEMSLIRTHPQVGYDILKSIDFPWPVAQIIYQHHERNDGSGYPLGIVDGDILIEAKILAVSDVVEAMASHRPYRASIGIQEALKEIEENKNQLYAADVVDACLYLFHNKNYVLE